MATQIPISIDDIFQSTKIGSLDKAIGNNIYGINHAQTPNAVPYNRERQGYLFFVRPQLNLQKDNCRNSRKFMPLISDAGVFPGQDPALSIHRIVRTTLDPRLITGYSLPGNPVAPGSSNNSTVTGGVNIPPITCPLVNNNMAFIPVLTNNIINSTGWPDPVVPLFTSHSGRYNESISMVDGIVEIFEQFTIDCTFRNTVMDPILYMFYIWALYSSNVFSGKMIPYIDFLVNKRIDYVTRIYRIRLDRNNYRVTKIMSTGPAIPIASSVGQFGDFNVDEILSSTNKDVSIRFQCTGLEIFDDILIYEFNSTVNIFKAEMRDSMRDTFMIMVPRSLNHIFQHRAYPRINPDTHVMEWWVDKALFDARTQAFLLQLGLTDTQTAEQNNLDELENSDLGL